MDQIPQKDLGCKMGTPRYASATLSGKVLRVVLPLLVTEVSNSLIGATCF